MSIKPVFDDAFDFGEGISCVKIDGKWGYIDKNGEIVINPIFEFASPLPGWASHGMHQCMNAGI